MAIGVYNPHKPGETVWLFRFEDVRDLIPDDIYKAIEESLPLIVIKMGMMPQRRSGRNGKLSISMMSNLI